MADVKPRDSRGVGEPAARNISLGQVMRSRHLIQMIEIKGSRPRGNIIKKVELTMQARITDWGALTTDTITKHDLVANSGWVHAWVKPAKTNNKFFSLVFKFKAKLDEQ